MSTLTGSNAGMPHRISRRDTSAGVARPPASFTGLHGRRVHPSRVLLLAGALAFGVLSNEIWLFIIGMSLIMGIVALGTLTVVGFARETTLMQAGLTGTAIYISGYLFRDNVGGKGLPFPVAALIAIAVTVSISVLVALVAARVSPMYIMVLTLAVQFTIENSVFLSGDLTGGLQAPQVRRPEFFGISLHSDRTLYFFLLAITVVLVVLMNRFRTSRFGRSMIMVGNDKEAAAAAGVNPWRYKVAAFAIGGLFAGIGGALWAPQLGAPPGVGQFSTMQSLFYLAIPVLAGFESIIGVVIVGMCFMALPMAMVQWGMSPQPLLLGGVALLVGVVMGPRGLIGALHDKGLRLRKAFAAEGPRALLVHPHLRRPRFLHMPDRELNHAYRELRKADDGDTPWDRSLTSATMKSAAIS
jgi:branched-chain amino acid transport system permease protein